MLKTMKNLLPVVVILAKITAVQLGGCPEGTWVTRVFITANSPAYASSVLVGFSCTCTRNPV